MPLNAVKLHFCAAMEGLARRDVVGTHGGIGAAAQTKKTRRKTCTGLEIADAAASANFPPR